MAEEELDFKSLGAISKELEDVFQKMSEEMMKLSASLTNSKNESELANLKIKHLEQENKQFKRLSIIQQEAQEKNFNFARQHDEITAKMEVMQVNHLKQILDANTKIREFENKLKTMDKENKETLSTRELELESLKYKLSIQEEMNHKLMGECQAAKEKHIASLEKLQFEKSDLEKKIMKERDRMQEEMMTKNSEIEKLNIAIKETKFHYEQQLLKARLKYDEVLQQPKVTAAPSNENIKKKMLQQKQEFDMELTGYKQQIEQLEQRLAMIKPKQPVSQIAKFKRITPEN